MCKIKRRATLIYCQMQQFPGVYIYLVLKKKKYRDISYSRKFIKFIVFLCNPLKNVVIAQWMQHFWRHNLLKVRNLHCSREFKQTFCQFRKICNCAKWRIFIPGVNKLRTKESWLSTCTLSKLMGKRAYLWFITLLSVYLSC